MLLLILKTRVCSTIENFLLLHGTFVGIERKSLLQVLMLHLTIACSQSFNWLSALKHDFYFALIGRKSIKLCLILGLFVVIS